MRSSEEEVNMESGRKGMQHGNWQKEVIVI